MKAHIISDYSIETLNRLPLGSSPHVQLLCHEINEIKKIGIRNISENYVSQLEKRLISSQIKFLSENDNSENYYTECFKNLGLTNSSTIEPHTVLSSIVYSVDSLIGENIKHLLIKDLHGGRIFESSGTTNPNGKKKVYYDEITCILSRELFKMSWEHLIGGSISKNDYLLMLMPPEAVYGMPFAALASDFYGYFGMQVYWGAEFINPPQIFTDNDFKIQRASLNFRNNVIPNKKAVAKFNLKSKLTKGNQLLSGLFPSLLALIENTRSFKGPKALFAKVKPKWIAYGGGMKKQGIPPTIQEGGKDKIAEYLKIVSDNTGFTLPDLLSKYESQNPSDLQDLDDVLLMYGNKRLLEWNIRGINVYAGADVQPSLFAIGSLYDVYGDRFYQKGPSNRPVKDIYFYQPGIIVELLDPITGEIIPRTNLERPGILLLWNPYNISHLQAIKTEDLMQWVEIPKRVQNVPPYLGGKGLQFVSRVTGAKGQGVCS